MGKVWGVVAVALVLAAPPAWADGPPLPGVKPPPPETPVRRLPYAGSPPPPYGGPVVGPPPIVPLPPPPGSEDATAAFKRDLLRPKVDALRQDDALGRLDGFGQRDLLNRQQELYRLDTDPLRR
jgi:hypothetical protein